jgi:hypothetical protein
MSLRLPAVTASITSGAIVVTVLAQRLSSTSAQTPTRARYLPEYRLRRSDSAEEFPRMDRLHNISSYHINGSGLEIACDPACPKVPGDGTARGSTEP